MAQSSFPFENVDTTETQFSQMFRTLNAGVNGTPAGTELKVSAGTGLQVSVAAGQAMVRGHYYISTAAELLTIGTANASNPRIDSVVLRLDPVANSIVLAVVAGTAAASPVAPTLTQTDAGVFEYLLGTVLVPAGSGTLSTITDTRTFMGSRLGIWATATRPVSPYVGQAGFNSTLGIPEWWNGSLWRAFVTAQEVADQSPRGNAIINGDFGINQRNFTSTSTPGQFGFDRWILGSNGGTVTYSAQSFTVGVAPVSGYEATNFARLAVSGHSSAGHYAQLVQRIEDVRTFAGQTATVSFWAKAASGTPKVLPSLYQSFGSGGSAGVANEGATVTLSTSWARYSVTIPVASISGKNVGAGSYLQTALLVSGEGSAVGVQNNTFDFWGVQVEAGSVASPFKTATGTKQGELAACQRYYFRIWADVAYGGFGIGVSANTTQSSIQVKLPVQMRNTPSSTLDWTGTASNYSVTRPGVAGYAATSLSISTTNTNNSIATLLVNSATLPAAGAPVTLEANNVAGAYLGFSAEL